MKPELLHKMCLGKRAYSTEHRANRVAHRILATRKVALRVYYCPVCMRFHLTHIDVAQPKQFAPAPVVVIVPVKPPKAKKVSKYRAAKDALAAEIQHKHPDWSRNKVTKAAKSQVSKMVWKQ